MRAMADEKGVDMLLVDAGDHHDGTGLVSTSPESAGQADEIFAKLGYDVLTLGNHELYQYYAARWIYDRRTQWWVAVVSRLTVGTDGSCLRM